MEDTSATAGQTLTAKKKFNRPNRANFMKADDGPFDA
jgi:hypothetical protein